MPLSKTSDNHTKGYWTKHFNNFLKPLIEESGDLLAYRSEALRGDILRQIITDLVTAPVVVADLTDNNSNVYWELGVRQSFSHGTITIAEEGTVLPFDIAAKGTLFYDPTDHLKISEFREKFREAIKDCLSHPNRPDSHVLEVISGRGSLYEIIERDGAIRRVDAVLSECKRNIDVFNEVIETIHENREFFNDSRGFPTSRFRWSAVELLITNRYIDEEPSFYKLAEDYMDEILTINDQLSLWEQSPDLTEDWILEEEKSAIKIFNKFKKSVVRVRKNLKTKF